MGLADRRHRVTRRFVHPDYNHTFANEYDIAILYLDTPVANTTPATLSWDSIDPSNGGNYSVRGVDAKSHAIEDGMVALWFNTKCQLAYTYGDITDSMACATTTQSSMTRGSPLITTKGHGDVVMGLVSWGNNPFVFVRLVSAKNFL
ncbi:Aste57867_2113 [Aphanomyces stellatus]|uniref:Aste57867_2113 protein n=1 Tax=Aphanomyces stellatus TaxID=120398 RepID=A0A485K9D5_9STRA|nr:hypothetical protein As57867_002108 [Aphanomyces stellatus]VFT79316.1 Aste57867_2113 [Aphanomyces stellatus]